ncbi:hypothetical protein HHX47_DHR1001009 [Lentinula edodes]|nr:hypothetical protein HHX47_DHR1001009 [Lentinula edodes]
MDASSDVPQRTRNSAFVAGIWGVGVPRLLLYHNPLLLFSFLLLSIPFAIVVSTAPTPWTLFAAAVWVWTWGVTRGVLRVTTAAVVGGWYFGVPWAPPLTSDVDLEAHLGRDLDLDLDLNQSPLPSPSSPPSLLLLSALTRASHSSLGSIVVSALRETALSSLSLVIRVLLLGVPALLFSLVALFSKFLPTPLRFLPTPLRFLRTPLSPLTHRLTRPLTNLIPHTSPFPQIYIALTGVSYRTATLRVSSLRGSVSSLRGSSQLHLTSGGSSSVGGFGGLGESRGLGGSGEPGGSRGLGGLGGSRGLGELRDLRGPLTSFPSLLSPLSPPLSLPLPFALITYYFFVSHTQSPTSLFPDSLSLSLSPPLALAPLSTPQALNTPQALSAPPQAGAPHALQAWQASLLAALTTALVGIFCVGVLRDVGDALWVCWVGDVGRERGSGRTFDTFDTGDGRTSEARGEGRRGEGREMGETEARGEGRSDRTRETEGRETGSDRTRETEARAARFETREDGRFETRETEGRGARGTEARETGTEEARGEDGREGLELGTGIKEHRDLVARVFEYLPARDTRDVPGTSREEEVDCLLPPDSPRSAEVIQIHQIPRSHPTHPHPYPHPPIPPSPPPPPHPSRPLSSPPLLSDSHDLTDTDDAAADAEDEDINPFHHSPNPSASSPYPAPSALPLAPVRSSTSSLSSLSDSSETELFPGSGLFG